MLCMLMIQFHLCTLILYISFFTVNSIGDSGTPCDDTLKEGVVEGFYFTLTSHTGYYCNERKSEINRM